METHSPAEAKEIASSIPRQLHIDWHAIKVCVMRDILHVKADYCPIFKSTLIASVGKRLVESTQDLFWASGLPPQVTSSTKPEYYPGRNTLGHILESVRADLVKEAVLLDLADPDTDNYDSSSSTTDINNALPTPLETELSEAHTTTTSTADQPPSTIETAEHPRTEIASDELDQDQASKHSSSSDPQRPTVVQSSKQSHTVKLVIGEQSVASLHVEPQIHIVTTSTPSLGKKKNKASRKGEINQTVVSMFALKKRKLSPEKEADTSQNDPKLTRRNSCSS